MGELLCDIQVSIDHLGLGRQAAMEIVARRSG